MTTAVLFVAALGLTAAVAAVAYGGTPTTALAIIGAFALLTAAAWATRSTGRRDQRGRRP